MGVFFLLMAILLLSPLQAVSEHSTVSRSTQAQQIVLLICISSSKRMICKKTSSFAENILLKKSISFKNIRKI
jgi:hypothetical protein